MCLLLLLEGLRYENEIKKAIHRIEMSRITFPWVRRCSGCSLVVRQSVGRLNSIGGDHSTGVINFTAPNEPYSFWSRVNKGKGLPCISPTESRYKGMVGIESYEESWEVQA